MIGSTIIELNSVDSTNTYAAGILDEAGFEDGTVVWAHQQFAGRGQDQHVWISEAGKNLTFTVCLKPRFMQAASQFRLNKAIALGVLDFLREYMAGSDQQEDTLDRAGDPVPVTREEPYIKWPNDLYIGKSKIGGILVENRIMGEHLRSCFAGIGININQTRFAPDIPNPVSLIHFLRHETVLKDALFSVCRCLDTRYTQLRGADPGIIDRDYDRFLLGFMEWQDFMQGTARLTGRIRGVDETGRLMLEEPGGRVTHYAHKEVEMVLGSR